MEVVIVIGDEIEWTAEKVEMLHEDIYGFLSGLYEDVNVWGRE